MTRACIRTDIAAALYKRIGLSRSESANMVGFILGELSGALVGGDTVKISGFGSFHTRHKRGRIGRNFKTGEAMTIAPRQVVVFRPSPALRQKVNTGGSDD